MADIETERNMSRSEVAEYLRSFADELDASGGTGTSETGSNDRTSDSGQRDTDSTQQNDTTSNDAETGTGNADTTGNANTTADSDTTDGSNTTASGNDANESTTSDTSDDDHATDVEQRNKQSNRSGGSGGRVTFMVGNESTTINPPEDVTFAVSVDSESSLIGSGTGRTARFALHWDESDISEDEGLSIQ